MNPRIDYIADLLNDAREITTEPNILAAIILADAVNGMRKAILALSDNTNLIARQHGCLVDTMKGLR